MLNLNKMTPEEFTTFFSTSVLLHAEANSKNLDITIEEAMAIAKENYNNLLPKGVETENHFFYSAIDKNSNAVIGSLWLGKRTQASKVYGFIFDIIIVPEARGKGHGRMLLNLAEAECKNMGLSSIGLHVFGHNQIALSLYEKSGFRKTNIYMMKDLI